MRRELIIAYGWLIIITTLLAFLKLFKVINWAWGWVLAPMWMPLAAGFIFMITLIIIIISQNRKRLKIDD